MSVEELVLFIFEMVGTVAFAISGAMVAIKKRVDVFGVIVLSAMTALGGGIVGIFLSVICRRRCSPTTDMSWLRLLRL